MTAIGFAVYAACVDFMLKLAALLGVTYRDANALVLFVALPAVTLVVVGFCAVEHVRLRRARGRRLVGYLRTKP